MAPLVFSKNLTMKKLALLLSIVLITMYVSCKKENDGPGEIYGRWKLTETLSDPGDGSGKYIKVKEDKYVAFDASGKILGDALPDLLTFRILDSVRIEVTAKNQKQPLTYWYKVSRTKLTLNPPCIEGCGLRFERK